MKKSFVMAAFAAGAVTLFAADEVKDQSAKPVHWKITGDLEEACSCDPACPCWFESKPTKMNCGGVQVLFIKKGTYGDTKLDGLAVANFVQSPDGESMMASFGKWNFSYLYVDEKATPEQRKALQEIGTQVLPLAASKKTAVRIAPITRTIKGGDHEITVGKYGSFKGRPVEGGLGGKVTITNPPGADPFHAKYVQGRNSSFTYNDAEQNWKHEGTNYMQGTFNVTSEQFAKHAVGLAQKMAAKKPPAPANGKK
ncbi:MAG: DUF1326 domain-containing protein [Prosthecobacter sp.]|nr:DUF1326 domain-containing protein [Prosthecobacter sp.]